MKKAQLLLVCFLMLTKALSALSSDFPISSAESSSIYLAIVAPTTQTSAVTIVNSTTDNNTFTVTWTKGNGASRVIFVKLTNALNPTPVNNTTYTANTVFGSGTECGAGSGWFCVYNGTGATGTVTVTGLAANSTYRVIAFEYNGAAGTQVYNTTVTGVNNSTTPNKGSQVITFNAITSQPYGTLDFDPGATINSGQTITYTSQNTAIVTIVSGKIHIIAPGTTTVTATQAGNASYYAAVSLVQSITITKASQTITFGALPAKYIGDADLAPGATASSGLTVSYASDNTAVATIVSGKIHSVAAGTANITASQAGNTNYLAATNVIQLVTVNKTLQTITVAPIITKTYGNADFSFTATSGLTVTYVITDPTVASIVSGKIHILTGGTTTITASQAGNATYGNAPDVIFTLNVLPTTQNITFTAIPSKVYGIVDFAPGASSTSGLTVTYTSSDLSVATIVLGKIHIVGAGTATITASQAGNINYSAATDVLQTLTVTKATQTIVLTTMPTKTYGNADFDPGATVNSGLPLTLTSSNPLVATVSGTTIHIVGAGTSNITYSQPGNSNYNAASDLVKVLTVNKSAQTITFAALAGATYGDGDIDPLGTVSSGLPLTYTSSNTAIATIVGNKIHILTAGSVNLTASQAGDGNNNAAASIARSLVIAKAGQTITFPAIPSKTCGISDFNPGATASSGLTVTYTSSNTAVATIVLGNIHIVGVGTSQITAAQTGNTNYALAPAVIVTLTVTIGSQIITFNPMAPMGFTTTDFSPATASSNLQITYTSSNTAVATIVSNKVHMVALGNTTITASQVGNANYTPAANVSQLLTIVQGPQTITMPATNSKAFSITDYSPATVNSGLTITYTSSNPSVATIVNNKVHMVGLGVTTIKASQSGSALFSAAPDVSQLLTITIGTQTITFGAMATIPYANINLSPATDNSGLPIVYTSSNTAVATIVNGQVHVVGSGTTQITASQPGNANFNPAVPISQMFTVNYTSQTIVFNPIPSQLYSTPDFDPGATVNTLLPIFYTSDDTTIAKIINGKIHIVARGSTMITASQPGNASASAALSISQVLTVATSTQAITFGTMANKHYGDADFDPGATATSGLTVRYSSDNPAVAIFEYGKIHIVGVGTTSITCSQNGDENFYAADNIVQSFTVLKGSQTIFFPSLTDAFCNDPNIFPMATATSSLPVTYTSSNTSVATIQGDQIHIVGAGTTIITAKQVGDVNYNAAPNVTTSLLVSKSSQTISFAPIAPMDYEDIYLNPASSSANLPIDYTSSNTAVAVILNGTIHIVGSGITTITAIQSGTANFLAATSVQQILTVNQIGQSILFYPLINRTYGDADFNLTGTASSGLPVTYVSSNPLVANVTGNLVHIIGAGSTSITAKQAGDITFTAASDVTNILVVVQKSQTIDFASFQANSYGDPDVLLTATSTSGLPVGYSSDNAAVATIVAGKVHIVAPGIANILAIQSGNSNYAAASSLSKVFLVNKASQTITFSVLPPATYGDADVTLTASSSSGLPVSFISDNTAIATIVAGKVHFISAGSVNIIAMQAGNSYYGAAPSVSNVLVVNNTSQSITFNAFPVMTYGDADLNFSATASSGLTVSFLNKYPTIASLISGKIHILGAGTDTITAIQPGNGSYQPAVSVPRALIIKKAAQSIVFNAIPAPAKVYGGPDFTLSATGGDSGNPVLFTSSDNSVATISGNTVTIVGVGTATITATQTGNGNYNAALPVSQGLTILKADNTILFYALPNKTFNDPDFDPAATSSSGLSVTYSSSNTAIATIVGGQIHIVGTGTSVITATQTGDSHYKAATPATQTLNVGKDLQTISFGTLTPRLYGDIDYNPGATATSGLPVTYTSDNVNVATIVGGNIHIVGGGTCVITATQAGNINYEEAASIQQTLQVKGINQSIIFNVIPTKSFGNSDFSPVAIASSGLPITYSSDNEAVATIVSVAGTNYIHITGVGTANIQANQTGNLNFNPALVQIQPLTVIKGNQVINFSSIPAKTYGNADFYPNVSTTSFLPVILASDNTAVAIIVNGNIRIIGAGTANITASQEGDVHYNAAPNVTKALTVKKESQTILFPVINPKTYGDADFDPGAYTTAGLNVTYKSSNTSVATITTDGINIPNYGLLYTVHILKAGTTTITATQTGNSNCMAATNSISKLLTVNKAPLTVTADDFVRNYGEDNPIFTAWYVGFVNGDDFSNFGAEPDVSCTATITSPVGDYAIIPSGGSSDNYSFIYQNGTLSIGASIPSKPPVPVGSTILCLEPDNQVYQINGNSTASTYKWSVTPANAAVITGTGKIVDVKFDKTFIGKAGLSTIGENPSGTSVASDTLYINVLPLPTVPEVIYDISYCLNNENADSIIMATTQNGYLYQLMLNGNNLGTPIAGNDERSGWYKIHYGTYAILEEKCNITLAKNIVIKEISELAKKPKLQVKWNDVIVCYNTVDSLNKYQWYQDGLAIPAATNQYLWTQKKQGKYYVWITDLDGCQAQSDTITINTSAGEIYPNPSAGQFKVSFTNSDRGKVKMNIYKMNSLLLQNQTFTKDLDLFEQDINLANVETGIYFIEITVNDQRVLYEKLIIQK